MKYKLERECANCKNIDIIYLTKFEASFELFDSDKIWNSECTKCLSLKCANLRHFHPKLDEEILNIWGVDEKLFFYEQDEELFLAEIEYFELILNKIDNSTFLKYKIDVLLEAICVLLYDNISSNEEYSDLENIERKKIADKIRPELIKRKEKIKHSEHQIMEYIKNEVFPQIGLEIKY